MLQDPNVERYVENAIRPLKKEIAKLKVKIEELPNSEQKTSELNVSYVMNSVLFDLEKLVSKYDKTQKSAVDEFDDNVNYGKVRALKEAIDIVKKHCT